jgi:hypothetical protein
MKTTRNQSGSLLIIVCVIITLIMVSSLGVFSLLLLSRETVYFRSASAKNLTAAHSVLNYGINTLIANQSSFIGDIPQNISIKIPEVPGTPTQTFGIVTITGASPAWQLQSVLQQEERVLCKVSCSFTLATDGRRTIKDWKIG